MNLFKRYTQKYNLMGIHDRLYVCENCGRLGVMANFQDECRPGWTHGRLVRIKAVSSEAVGVVERECPLV